MGQRHECYVYKNREIERASERASEFWPLTILVSLAFTSKNEVKMVSKRRVYVNKWMPEVIINLGKCIRFYSIKWFINVKIDSLLTTAYSTLIKKIKNTGRKRVLSVIAKTVFFGQYMA